MKSCVRCYVSGRVQGVFYRANTQRQAERLGLTGFARNLPDGRVEVLACGRIEAIDELKEWLCQGPPSAEVTGVSSEMLPMQDFATFTTG